MMLKVVDLPTLGMPTTPAFTWFVGRPRITRGFSSSFFLGAILSSWVCLSRWASVRFFRHVEGGCALFPEVLSMFPPHQRRLQGEVAPALAHRLTFACANIRQGRVLSMSRSGCSSSKPHDADELLACDPRTTKEMMSSTTIARGRMSLRRATRVILMIGCAMSRVGRRRSRSRGGIVDRVRRTGTRRRAASAGAAAPHGRRRNGRRGRTIRSYSWP